MTTTTIPTQTSKPGAMKPSQLATYLEHVFKQDVPMPVLIVSPPGLGKSSIVEQAVQAAGADLILSHPVTADPTDFKGLPWPDDSKNFANFLPYGDVYQAMHATKRTVWFLDDLGQAAQSVQAAAMQLLLAREINGHKIPDCVVFVAASNRRTDRAGVMGILEPVKSRFVTIIELVPDVGDWINWAFANNIDPVLIAFQQLRGDELLCAFEPTADMTNSPVPRTWHNLDKNLKLGLPAAIENAALVGAVGEGAAREFNGFRELYKQMPNINAILSDPDGQDIPDNPNVLWALVSALVYKTNEKTFERTGRYAERLATEGHGELAAFYVVHAVRQCPAVQTTPTYVRLAEGEVGKLFAGTYADE